MPARPSATPWRAALRRGALACLLAAALAGCDAPAAGDPPPGVLHLGLAAAVGDVAGVLYAVSCDDGTAWTAYVPLSVDPGLPEHVSPDLAGEPYADLFFLTGAASCVVDATPMASPTEPSADCLPASVTVAATPGVTTEALLVLTCPSETAGADVATLLNRAPDVAKVTVTPDATVPPCVEVRLTPSAADPDGDAVVLAFDLFPPAGAEVVAEAASATDLAFTPATPGVYEVVVTAADPWSTTEVTVPVTVTPGDAPCATSP